MTRCATAAEFVARFRAYCDGDSVFVTTTATRPVGLESPFAILLADKSPVLCGEGVVLEAFTTPGNRYKRPGLRIGFRRLTKKSQAVVAQLRARPASSADGVPVATDEARDVTERTPPPRPPPTPPTAPRATTPPPARPEPEPEPERTPGSPLILPANPLTDLSDESLGGFVDCQLYEETGNYFRIDGDDTTGPILPVPPVPPVPTPPMMPLATPPPLMMAPPLPPIYAPPPLPPQLLAPPREAPPDAPRGRLLIGIAIGAVVVAFMIAFTIAVWIRVRHGS
ncbi:MAG TPA: hypothetical protein VLX92_14875 [Kofleriaceae bacterium]|nr:hypothetical protein [Kofleriaceae bacterium]